MLPRTFKQNITLAIILAAVAGAVNAASFFLLGTHVSHMTGTVAAVGESLAGGHQPLAREAAKHLLAFVAGAASAAGLLDLMAKRARGRYTPALALEALVLLSCALFILEHPGAQPTRLISALCFAMGLQNALVTRISGAIVRTTHLTGVLTDLGMELIHVARWLHARFKERGARGLVRLGRDLAEATEFERAWLHLALIASFLLGATVGPLFLLISSEAAVALPVVGLVALIARDLRATTREASL